jgi:hypothetical protein
MPQPPLVTHFEVADTLVIGDPCQLDAFEGAAGLDHFLVVPLDNSAGQWTARHVPASSETAARIAEMRLTRDGTDYTDRFEIAGGAGVDSGHLLAICQRRLPIDYDAFLAQLRERGRDEPRAYEFAGGALTATGAGDGFYTVEVARYAGAPCAVRVRFLGE